MQVVVLLVASFFSSKIESHYSTFSGQRQQRRRGKESRTVSVENMTRTKRKRKKETSCPQLGLKVVTHLLPQGWYYNPRLCCMSTIVPRYQNPSQHTIFEGMHELYQDPSSIIDLQKQQEIPIFQFRELEVL